MVREEGRGAQIRPEEWRIMKVIFAVVTAEAAMMRSPSFSRDGESRTMMKEPFPKGEGVSLGKGVFGGRLSRGNGLVLWELDGDGLGGGAAQRICQNVLNASIQSSIESKSIFALPLTVILPRCPPA